MIYKLILNKKVIKFIQKRDLKNKNNIPLSKLEVRY